jgi:hypothetical protein
MSIVSPNLLGGSIMPINIKECDGGIGIIIESRDRVTDQELIDSLEKPLTHEKEKFKTYKYILIDHTSLTSLNITDETVDYISGLLAETSNVNPDVIVAMVAYVSYGANIDLIDTMSQMRELFMNRSCWEALQFKTKPYAVRWIKEKVNDKFGIDDLTFG